MTMTKQQRQLLWELFLMVRELQPPGEVTNRRLTEWAQRFQELKAQDGD
jgi:hypothetical protein